MFISWTFPIGFLLKPTQRFGRLKLPPFSSEHYSINKLAHGLTVKLYTEPVGLPNAKM